MGTAGQGAALQEQAWELQGIRSWMHTVSHKMTAKVRGMSEPEQSLQGTSSHPSALPSTEEAAGHSAPRERAHGLNDQQSRKYHGHVGEVWSQRSRPAFGGTGLCISAAEDQRDGTQHKDSQRAEERQLC